MLTATTVAIVSGEMTSVIGVRPTNPVRITKDSSSALKIIGTMTSVQSRVVSFGYYFLY